MKQGLVSRHVLWMIAASALLCLVSLGDADEGGKGKGKGKGAKGEKSSKVEKGKGYKGEKSSKEEKGKGTIQIDLNKLPPNLAKQLQSYLESKGSKKMAKEQPHTKKAFSAANLPPGLANKPANHPGRVNWLKAHGGSESSIQKGKHHKKG